ncbi:phage tail length tape measure family protein [Rhizobium ruizarguesonis]
MSGQMEFELIFRAQTNAARTATNELRKDVGALGNEAGQSAAAFDKHAASMDRDAAAAETLSRAADTTRRTLASISSAANAAQPSMERLVNTFARLDAPAANRNGRAADIAAYGQELDRLQAKFDPLFAAQQRYQTKLAEISQAEKVGALSASNAIDIRLREKNTYDALINNLDRLGMARKAAAEGVVSNQAIVPDRGADVEAYGRQLDQMRAKFNPVYAALSSYRERLAEIREAHKVGAISTDEMTAAISRQRQATLATVSALKGTGQANDDGPGGQFRRQNLTYQLFDIGQGVSGGMPLSMVAAQQVPQIAQMYAGQGGVNAAIKDFGSIASGAARLLTPLTIGVGALTSAAAIGVSAWSGYLTSMKEVETAANGLGRATAGTAEFMENAARAGADAAGISVTAARSMEAQFLRTGKIGSENFQQLIGLSKDFAATIGTDADAAGDKLASMFADPAAAAQTLWRQYGLINAATAEQAIRLSAQNRQSEAQKVLLDALPSRLANAAEATTALGRAWEYVAKSASNAWDSIGSGIDRAVSGPSLEERMQDAAKRYQRFSNQGWFLDTFNGAGDNAAKAKAEYDALNEEYRRQQQGEFQRRRAAEAEQSAGPAIDIASSASATADARRRRTLQDQIAALQQARQIPADLNPMSGDQQSDVAQAYDAKTRALDTFMSSQEKAQRLADIDLKIEAERNPLVRANLAAERERIQLAGEEITSQEALARAEAARNQVVLEAISNAQTQVTDMRTEIEIRQRLNSMVAAGAITSQDANTLLQEELTLRPLIAAAAAAEGAEKEELNKVIAGLKEGYAALADEQKDAAAIDYLRGGNEKLEQLRLEKALIGENETVRARAMAQLEAEQRIRSMGLAADSQRASQIRAQALEQANLNREIEKQSQAWEKVQSSAENAIDSTVDGLTSGDIGGALENIASDIGKTFSELAIKNPLKNALLGTDYGTISDVGGLGGIFSRLFGGGEKDTGSIVSQAIGQSVGTMSVNAATVVVNGGVTGGLTGLFGGAANDNASGLAGVIPVSRAALPDVSANGDIASYIAQAAAKRGIDPNVALAVARSEGGLSSWNMQSNVFKNGIQEPSFGPFQLYKGGGLGNAFMAKTGLDPAMSANGPAGVDFALDYASKNGWGSWYGAGKAGISNWQGIGADNNMNSAADAVKKLGTSAGTASTNFNALGGGIGRLDSSVTGATQNLGTFGNGLNQFGNNLASSFPAAPSGGSGGNWFSNLFGGLFGGGGLNSYGQSVLGSSTQFSSAWTGGGIGLYDVGGWTGPGSEKDVAGVVHADEFVFSKKAVQRVGAAKLDALHKGLLRGYETGGYASVGSVYPSAANSNAGQGGMPNLQIINQSSTPITGQVEEGRDESGRRNYRLTLSDEIGNAAEQKGGGFRRTMGRQYGLRTQGIAR